MQRFLALVAATLLGCAAAPNGRAADARAPLRVMTFNIEYGSAGLDTIAGTIRAAGAEIVGLQEVDVHWSPRSAFVDQASALAQRLGMQVRFAPIYSLPGLHDADSRREFGVALLTRLPITAFRNDTLTRLSTQEKEPVAMPMPGLLDATLDAHGTSIRVLVTHLDYRADPRVRAAQVAETLHQLDASSAPTLLFGDLNAVPDSPELAPLLARLRDAAPSTNGAGLTYPADVPAKRIDYVLASSRFRVRSAAVIDARASDHRPVVATLDLPRR